MVSDPGYNHPVCKPWQIVVVLKIKCLTNDDALLAHVRLQANIVHILSRIVLGSILVIIQCSLQQLDSIAKQKPCEIISKHKELLTRLK